MKNISVFYQGEGLSGLEHIEIIETETFGDLRAAIIEKHGLAGETILFIEDEIEAIDDEIPIASKAGRAGVKAHVHRCREVKATVHFKDKSVHHKFTPGTTVAHVKHWAAIHKFGMTEEEASHHHLQLSGTEQQPDPGTHIGTLVSAHQCAVEFDLVSTPRVNG
ncbi:hypothetical protein JQ634_22245 [Bradyrhizobium sp. AUGA SZCCT0240]|uniref:hypothetical protein n=1 Tax=Bradyrhizobium sp. AUGA SZCCT0240 TaxID=2807669 RepID=UPI001BA8D158|nr:hypothetical protein [Bradyrhizobium sp. AUGA SZCCT0240]MBR1256414.1 hypothetical protein [Bradyrhizobium sp. AUGA SZCCT0240]